MNWRFWQERFDMNDEERDEFSRKAIEFEMNYGTDNFLKIALSSVNRLLVEKGLVTKDELAQSFEEQRQGFERKHQEAIAAELEKGGRISPDRFEELADLEDECPSVMAISPRLLKAMRESNGETEETNDTTSPS